MSDTTSDMISDIQAWSQRVKLKQQQEKLLKAGRTPSADLLPLPSSRDNSQSQLLFSDSSSETGEAHPLQRKAPNLYYLIVRNCSESIITIDEQLDITQLNPAGWWMMDGR